MKDDTISRAAAIDVMMKLQAEDIEAYGASIPEGFDGDRAVTAIKALPSAQPECEDAVSRFEVLRLIDYSSNDLNDSVDNWYFQGKVKELPPVTPKQPGWIPTSVKPPEPFKLVLIQDYCGCYELNTYIPPRINPKQYPNGYWGEVGTVDFDYFDVEAWCPLPAPYCPEGEEHEQSD